VLRGVLRSRALGALLTTLGLAFACRGPVREETSSVARAVVNGEASPAGPEDAVLILLADVEPGTLCSATLVAPNLAVTARHCVAAIVEGDFLCSDSGELENDGNGAGLFAEEYPPEQLLFFGGPPRRSEPLAKGVAVLSTLPTHICVNDLAFVVLDRAVALPALPLRFEAPAAVGERVTVVGYGPPPQGLLLLQTAPRERKTGVVIDAVGPDSALDGVASPAPRSFITSGAYACLGDSGAPAIAESDGRVVGVYSTQQGSSCLGDDVVNHFVHVPAYRDLVERAFAAAGARWPATSEGGAAGATGGGAATEAGVGGDATSSGGAFGEASGGARTEANAGAGDAESGFGGAAGDPGGAAHAGVAEQTAPHSLIPSGGCALSSTSTLEAPASWFVAFAAAAAAAVRRRRRSALRAAASF
jgi:MYXO-CTERM domain-containing protein